MKKFILKVIMFGILVSIVITCITMYIPINDNDYLQAYKLKENLLEKIESPRLIFVGGSNLAFGLDSKQIKDSLKMNVINYGLHAGIGLKYMIDDISNYLHKDDIVVIVPEYSHFFYQAYGVPETIAPFLKVCDGKNLDMFDFKQICKIIVGLPSIIKYSMQNYDNERNYTLSGFNEFGDEVKHWQLPSIDIPAPIGITRDSLDYNFCNYFINKLQKIENKCQVVLVPPVYRECAFKKNINQIYLVDRFLEDSGFPFIISPVKCALPDKYAYDTDYHMSYDGVQLFTKSIIKSLNKAL